MRDAAARAAVPRNPGSRSRPSPPPGSLAAAPTRPTSHVAARHFVWRGRRGCLITRGGRSMRTGGGVSLPGRRPLPAIHTLCSASRASTRRRLRVPARSAARAGAPPSPPRDPAPGPGDPRTDRPERSFSERKGCCISRVPGTPSRASPLRLCRRKGKSCPEADPEVRRMIDGWSRGTGRRLNGRGAARTPVDSNVGLEPGLGAPEKLLERSGPVSSR